MGSVDKTVGENLVVILVQRTSHANVGSNGIRLESSDKSLRPIRRDDLRVIIDLERGSHGENRAAKGYLIKVVVVILVSLEHQLTNDLRRSSLQKCWKKTKVRE